MPAVQVVEDLMQEIVVAAWQGLPKFRGDSGLRPWVLGIARHKVEDFYRRRLRALEVQQDDESSWEPTVLPMIEEQIDAALRQEKVQKTLATLPEAHRLALLWRYRDNASLREMAELTGKTEKAIERLLARARDNFRKRWTDANP
jgi:RNA polymerase sigma factor (sigma-70 family)